MTKSDIQKKFIVAYIPGGEESIAGKHAHNRHSGRGRKLRNHIFYYNPKGGRARNRASLHNLKAYPQGRTSSI